MHTDERICIEEVATSASLLFSKRDFGWVI